MITKKYIPPVLMSAHFMHLCILCASKQDINLVVLGAKYSGKTELWFRLRDKKRPKGTTDNTAKEKIESFTLKSKEGSIRLNASIDIGGDNSWVRDYDNIIHNNSIIYYLLDVTQLNKDTSTQQAQLRKIGTLLKNYNCKLTLLGTFFDQYDGDEEKARKEIKKNFKDIVGLSIHDLPIILINTTDGACIDRIKSDIIQNSKLFN
ncbi:MAG: GTPase domain-containing protein [Lachnospiraceae bacterium]|nr:GTPase domain-containing protein [Lachnospiraceae bacterium]